MLTASIESAGPSDSATITALAGELLEEIQAGIGEELFRFDPPASRARLEVALHQRRCMVFLARSPGSSREPQGFLALCEGFALYAEGTFGIVTELYVRPAHRGQGLGRRLLAAAFDHGRRQGWARLEVTTPPLPAFARSLAFYERQGFMVSGGLKLRCLIAASQGP